MVEMSDITDPDKLGVDLNTETETKVDREHERILNEIETTDTAFIGASLRYEFFKYSEIH